MQVVGSDIIRTCLVHVHNYIRKVVRKEKKSRVCVHAVALLSKNLILHTWKSVSVPHHANISLSFPFYVTCFFILSGSGSDINVHLHSFFFVFLCYYTILRAIRLFKYFLRYFHKSILVSPLLAITDNIYLFVTGKPQFSGPNRKTRRNDSFENY